MTPERWRRIEDVYHAALARQPEGRDAVVAEACAGDEALRREVASLLAQHASLAGTLAGAAVGMAAQLVSLPAESVLTGRRLGGYQITAPLGKGGMGEVYRARDTRLGREVAIKILPRAFTSDPDRLARFEREARVLASLNHPAIATIYGVEDADGIRALVMELVEGETLATRIARGAIPVAAALPLARQIADALDAAHEKGIVHRDLKPGNITITPEGAVKVLDFGLAKAGGAGQAGEAGREVLSNSPTMTIGGTLDGIILGTAAYMSPEQARGLAVDKRTDIWAFGCVLYEMLTGRNIFQGETVSDTIGAILNREPDWGLLPADVSPSVTQLLRHCLDRDQRRRLRDIGDVRFHVDEPPLARQHESSERTTSRSRGLLWWWRAAAVALAAAAGIGGWWIRDRALPLDNPLATAHFTRFTDFEGIERDAALSPDGKFVAFISDREGPFDVWMSQVGTGRFLNLTQGKAANLDSTLRVMGFAGDGAELWVHDGDASSPLRLLPLIGGSARVFLASSPAKTPPMNAAWSPDAKRLLYHTSDAGD